MRAGRQGDTELDFPPGNVAELRLEVDVLGMVAARCGDINSDLSGALRSLSGPAWSGKAATGFHSHMQTPAQVLSEISGNITAVTGAVSAYADSLEAAQRKYQQARAKAEAAGLRFIGPIQIDPTSLLTPPDPHKAQVAAEVALAIESALFDAARAAATLEAALIGPAHQARDEFPYRLAGARAAEWIGAKSQALGDAANRAWNEYHVKGVVSAASSAVGGAKERLTQLEGAAQKEAKALQDARDEELRVARRAVGIGIAGPGGWALRLEADAEKWTKNHLPALAAKLPVPLKIFAQQAAKKASPYLRTVAEQAKEKAIQADYGPRIDKWVTQGDNYKILRRAATGGSVVLLLPAAYIAYQDESKRYEDVQGPGKVVGISLGVGADVLLPLAGEWVGGRVGTFVGAAIGGEVGSRAGPEGAVGGGGGGAVVGGTAGMVVGSLGGAGLAEVANNKLHDFLKGRHP